MTNSKQGLGAGAVLVGVLFFGCSADSKTQPNDLTDASAETPRDGETGGTLPDGAMPDGKVEPDGSSTNPSELPEELIGVDLSDPQAAEPDLSGEVAVNGPKVLTENMVGAYPGDLNVIDLTLGIAHPAGRGSFYNGVAQGGATLVTSGANAAATDNISILRLTDGGFLPQIKVQGYAATQGNFYIEGYSADERFGVFTRRVSGNTGIEVIDLVKGKRHGFIEDPLDSSQGAKMAPAGYYFSVNFSNYEVDPAVEIHGFSKITRDGVAPFVKLPDDTLRTVFSGDGKRLYYVRGAKTGPRTLWMSELPNLGEPVPIDAAGLEFSGSFDPTGTDLRVALSPSGSDQVVWYRLDALGKVTPVTDSKRSVYTLIERKAESLLLLYQEGASLSLELIQYGKTHRLTTYDADDASSSAAFAGERVHYVKDNRLHVVGVDAEGLHDVIVQEASELVQCVDVANGLMTLQTGNDNGLVFVNLKPAKAKRFAKLPLSVGAMDRSCPLRHRTKNSIVYRERTATKTQLWTLDINDGAIGTPLKKYEVDTSPDYTILPRLFGG